VEKKISGVLTFLTDHDGGEGVHVTAHDTNVQRTHTGSKQNTWTQKTEQATPLGRNTALPPRATQEDHRPLEDFLSLSQPSRGRVDKLKLVDVR